MSIKKKVGAVRQGSGQIWRRRLPSISASATSRVSPSPSDSTTVDVSAPGRWILPIASRSTVERTRGAARQSLKAEADDAEHDEGADRRADEDGGDRRLVGETDGERREQRRGRARRRQR